MEKDKINMIFKFVLKYKASGSDDYDGISSVVLENICRHVYQYYRGIPNLCIKFAGKISILTAKKY